MLTIATQRTEALTEAERAAIIRLCIAAHGKDDFQHLFSFLPPEGLHILGMEDRALVGHAVVTTRWLQPAGLPLLKTGYVDAVSTLPARQGEGVGSAVMRALAAAITEEYEIACLETQRDGFYARLDWEIWPGPLAGRGPDGLIPTPDQRWVMILRLPRTPDLDPTGLLTIECQPARIW